MKCLKPNLFLVLAIRLMKNLLLRDENNAVDPHIWFDLDLWKQALDVAVEELKKYSPNDSRIL